MKSLLLYFGFCVLLAAAFGCALTDYGVITDNDQAPRDPNPPGGPACKSPCTVTAFGCQCPIATNGPAHIEETSQIATIWPDGTDELINFVDQKSNGTATLTTYNNFSSGSAPTFHDDLYCNPDWQGCSIFTAPDDNDANLFDGTFNGNCSGARSLSLLLSTGRYYGECGRVDKLSTEDKLSLLAMGQIAERYGQQGLLYHWGASNLSLTLENEDGEAYNAPVVGDGSLWFSSRTNVGTHDLTNSLFGATVGWYATWQDRHATDVTTVTVCYSGVCAETVIAGKGFVTGGSRIRQLKNSRY